MYRGVKTFNTYCILYVFPETLMSDVESFNDDRIIGIWCEQFLLENNVKKNVFPETLMCTS
jgi:hypothetical protein